VLDVFLDFANLRMHVTDQIVLGLRKLFMSSRAAQAAPQTVPMQPSTNAIASKFFM
jgi:hypothetical protein